MNVAHLRFSLTVSIVMKTMFRIMFLKCYKNVMWYLTVCKVQSGLIFFFESGYLNLITCNLLLPNPEYDLILCSLQQVSQDVLR